MTQASEQLPAPQIVRQGYEPADVSVRGLLWFVVVLVLCVFGSSVVSWFLVRHYMSVPRAVDVPRSSVPSIDRFTAPNLQPTQNHNALPQQDLAELRSDEAKIFDQLGWKVDPDTQAPRIPDAIVGELARTYSAVSATQPSGGGQPR